MMLIKKGAEADIYLVDWYGKKAVSKVRNPKSYRNKVLDVEIRTKRTLHEAEMLANAKRAGVSTPLLYFVDRNNAEIVMQYIKGKLARDLIERDLSICKDMGVYAAKLHVSNIVHGDLTTSNFIVNGCKPTLFDFGLAFHSGKIEDKAVDIRLIKEIMSSAHASVFKEAFDNFIGGYESVTGKVFASKILAKVREIERRGRYARVV